MFLRNLTSRVTPARSGEAKPKTRQERRVVFGGQYWDSRYDGARTVTAAQAGGYVTGDTSEVVGVQAIRLHHKNGEETGKDGAIWRMPSNAAANAAYLLSRRALANYVNRVEDRARPIKATLSFIGAVGVVGLLVDGIQGGSITGDVIAYVKDLLGFAPSAPDTGLMGLTPPAPDSIMANAMPPGPAHDVAPL